MNANPIRGEVEIAIGGQPRILRYGWDEIAKLQAKFGDDLDKVLLAAVSKPDLQAIAEILAIGLIAGWPGVTADIIKSASPPIAATSSSVMEAFKLAWQGPEGSLEQKADPMKPPGTTD